MVHPEIQARLQTVFAAINRANDEQPEPALKLIADTTLDLIGEVLSDFKRIADATERCAAAFEEFNKSVHVFDHDGDSLAGDSELADKIIDGERQIAVNIHGGTDALGSSIMLFSCTYVRNVTGDIVPQPEPREGWRFWQEQPGDWHGERTFT